MTLRERQILRLADTVALNLRSLSGDTGFEGVDVGREGGESREKGEGGSVGFGDDGSGGFGREGRGELDDLRKCVRVSDPVNSGCRRIVGQEGTRQAQEEEKKSAPRRRKRILLSLQGTSQAPYSPSR